MDKPKHSVLTGSLSVLQAHVSPTRDATEGKPSRAAPIVIGILSQIVKTLELTINTIQKTYETKNYKDILSEDDIDQLKQYRKI